MKATVTSHIQQIICSLDKSSLLQILSELQIQILYIDNENTSFQHGAALKINDFPFIFIENNLEEALEEYVICHELGHILMHDFQSISHFSSNVKSKKEREANIFAVHILAHIHNCQPEEIVYSLNDYYNLNIDIL